MRILGGSEMIYLVALFFEAYGVLNVDSYGYFPGKLSRTVKTWI